MLSSTLMLLRLSVAHPAHPVYRLLPRTIHASCITQRYDPPNPVSHGTENYFVDRDDAPPPNTSVYKVDATSDAVESAYEPPSGPWSRVGAETKEYQTVSKDEPYEVSKGKETKLRDGGMKREAKESKTGRGPEGAEGWG